LYFGTLGLVLEPMASTLMKLMINEQGRRLVMLDPNIRVGLIPDSVYHARLHAAISKSTIVKASEADLAWLYPGLGYEQAADRILDEGVSLVVVTLGARGAFGGHRDARMFVAAPEVDVVDTIGAGDAFGAALLAWLNDHDLLRPNLLMSPGELRESLGFACLVASLTCARAGADPPTRADLRKLES
jgi:fructokinase